MRTELTEPTTFILSPNGADYGDGRSSPWRSLSYAMARLWNDYDARGNQVTVELWPASGGAAEYDNFQVHGPMLGCPFRYGVSIVGRGAINPTFGPNLVIVRGANVMTGGAQLRIAGVSIESSNPAAPDVGGLSTDDGGSHCYAEQIRWGTFRDFYAQAGTQSRMKIAGGVHWFTAGGARAGFAFVGPAAQLQIYGGTGMMYFNETNGGKYPDYPIGFLYGTEMSWANIGPFGWNGAPTGPRVCMNLGARVFASPHAVQPTAMPGNGTPQIDAANGCWWAA